jgi:hypothetical protein
VEKQNQEEPRFLIKYPEVPKTKCSIKTKKALSSSKPTPTYSLDSRLSCLSASPISPTDGYHSQVRAPPYTPFRRHFNLTLYFRTPPSNQASPPPLGPLSGAGWPPLSPSFLSLRVPVDFSNLILLLQSCSSTRYLRSDGSEHQEYISCPIRARSNAQVASSMIRA